MKQINRKRIVFIKQSMLRSGTTALHAFHNRSHVKVTANSHRLIGLVELLGPELVALKWLTHKVFMIWRPSDSINTSLSKIYFLQ